MAYSAGAKVGFFQGDIRLLPDDMKALQPTIFPVVPRLLNRVYDRVSINDTTAPFFLSFCSRYQTQNFPFLLVKNKNPVAGSEWSQNALQEMAVELCRGQEVC